MKILVIGSGGREHALVWKLSQEADVIATPGNAGIASIVPTFDVASDDFSGIEALARREQIDLVVVGPEDPLVTGLADHLRSGGIAVFGPSADAARLEASKTFSKDLMLQAGVPTAAYQSFTEAEPAADYARSRFDAGRGVAVKASGNALGKGVVVCETIDQADDAIQMMLVDQELGPAGAKIVIEDRLVGFEFSLLTLVSDSHILSLPVAQDYKRALDGDRGPNTGGMGSYSPVPRVTADMIASTEDAVVRPILRSLASQGIGYRGVLFSGLMVDSGNTLCLEYNVRFGDPETQSVVRRLGAGLAGALMACALGGDIPPVAVEPNASVTVVMAAKGYPGKYEKGFPITIPDMPEGVEVFHAGTEMLDGQLRSKGGRVLAVSAEAETIETARDRAYSAVKLIETPGLRYRSDVAASTDFA